MEAKNKMIFGRQKNRILRAKDGFTPNFWAGLAVRAGPGEGNIRMGVGPVARNLRLNLEA